MRKFVSLALNTSRDIIRQPVIVVLTVACIITMGMLPIITVFTLGEEERIVRDGAVAASFVYGLLLVVSSSIASISRQIRNGTAGSVLAKPVSRELFFGATYCGIVLVCLLFVTIALISAMLSVRMALRGIHTDWLIGVVFAAAVLSAFALAAVANYRGQNFCPALFKALLLCLLMALFIAAFLDPDGRLVHFGELIRWRLAPVSVLLFGALSMLAAIAVALSTRFAPVVVFFCCCLVFILGLISNYLLVTVAGDTPLARVCAFALPDWQCLWVDETPDAGRALRPEYILKACGYAVLYICGVLSLGVLSFRNTEA